MSKRLPPKPWPRLTETAMHPSPPASLEICQLCGQSGAHLLYECDENDRAERDRVLVTCRRKPCTKQVSAHPRLYVDAGMGYPGHLPKLCPGCAYQDGTRCTHPDLRENGGAGLVVSLRGLRGIVCSRGRGCRPLPRVAEKCAGRSALRLVGGER